MALDPALVFAFALRLHPEADEGALLTTLDLQLDVRGLDSLGNLDVDQTLHCVAGLVEGVSGLQLNVTLGELAPRV